MKKKGAAKKTAGKKVIAKKDKDFSKSSKSKTQLVAEEKEHRRSKPYPIVAIGASAGGIEAVTQLLKNLSPDTGMAYVYIQHLDPTHESMLSSILSKSTAMPVAEAEEQMRIQPNHVFVIPPNKDMQIVDGVLTLNPRPVGKELHLPINRFFMSLADKQKEGSIGIVLSGSASDGTLGLKAIKAAGGITFAQDETAKFQSMPKSAIAEGGADLVMSPVEIAKELERLSSQPEILNAVIAPAEEESGTKEFSEELVSVLQLLRKSMGVDFSNYKTTTIRRRIERRMLLHKLNSHKEYFEYIKQHTGEVNTLFHDLLINVTTFFRDADLCDYLKSSVLPEIIKSKTKDDPIRIWIPACSTGQESYSLAIMLLELLGNKAHDTSIQIFSTDLSEHAINKARIGLYSKSEVADVSPQRLERYFVKEDNHYRIIKSIRDLCVFATHNIFKDPPFSRIDLVSCCNLLIYLDTMLQKKAIATFHYALNTDSYLVLGSTESIGTATNLFVPLEKKLKIYQRKKDGNARAAFERTFLHQERDLQPARRVFHSKYEKDNIPDLEKTVDNILLNNFIPACVVVNEDLEILQFRGSTSLFLEPAPGKASLNLIKMARAGLGFELHNAVHKASKSGQPVKKSGIELKGKNSVQNVSIEVVPVKSDDSYTNYIILFEEEKTPVKTEVKGNKKDLRSEKLEAELMAAREDMSAIIEEREAMNEELQSANEEIVSSNEELQSINEELETSKEEIESTNEELQTINQELSTRNEQLSEAFNFADAIFGTMREALVVLDENLRILRANNTFYKLFKTTGEVTDNRLIFEIGNRQWDIPKLRQLLEEIIPANNIFYGFEVKHVFPGIGEKVMILNARKILQPAMQQQMILLAIEDITDHVVAARVFAEQEFLFRDVANNAPVMIWTADEEGNRNFFNKAWLEFTGKTAEQEKAMGWMENIHPDDRDSLLKIYNKAFAAKESYSFEYRLRRNDNEYRWVLSTAIPSLDENKKLSGYIGTVTEIHEKKMFTAELEDKVQRRTKALQEAKLSLERSNEELKQFAYVASHDLQEPLRKISTFSDKMQEKFKQDLPEEAKDYLDRMRKASLNMTKMINDLLDFSRAHNLTEKYTEIDLKGAVLRAIKDYDLLITQKKAKINVGQLPTISAIHVQMQQLFANLVSNALKFSNHHGDPEINISSRILDDKEIKQFPSLDTKYKYCEIKVEDNGIGFSAADSDKIFNIFQRLHGKNEFPGTGIGLALCRKIVENHGGIIFAKGEEEKGAAFHIILPTDRQL